MEKCLLIYNAYSGRGKIAKKEKKIIKLLSQKFQTTVCKTEYAGHLGEIVSQYGHENDIIVVGGGDGTINEAVNAIAKLGERKKLGIIPSGTVNDVAHSLKIPINVIKATKNIIKGQTFAHDIFKMNDRFGIYVCCAGLFTESSYATSQSQKKKLGALAYALHGVKKVFSTKAVNLKLTYENGEIEGKFALMLLINSRRVAGFKLNKKAILNDGFIDVVLVKSENDIVKFGAIKRVAFLFLRGISKGKIKGVTILKLSNFKVETCDEVVINLDGEKIGAGSFEFSVVKEGIDIIVPSITKLRKNMIPKTSIK